MKNFEVIDFKFIEVTDNYDEKYISNWSRPYEYKYVIDFIINHSNKKDIMIHNTSCGGQFDIHNIFRDELDNIGICVHSDIVKFPLRDTYYYDITEEHKDFENKFDFVLNVSTIEHLSGIERIIAIQNLLNQVKNGGYLIMTFDYPEVNLNEIEEFTKIKCNTSKNSLNGLNSVTPNPNFKHLNIVCLILKIT
jgi:SAM-dependent methyltransferase